MKLPLSWLREYVDVDLSAEALAEKLTFSGVEVEGIETVGGTYDGVVVGEVRSVAAHPGADRLKVCRVDAGGTAVPVVCGAENFGVGDKAAFAGVGAVLPNGMKIKRAKLRGEVSEGMLCAEDELGISNDHSGILLLPSDVKPGTPLAEVLGPPDQVLELEVTWNRPDCLCIVGLAREVAALCGVPIRLPPVEFPESGPPVGELASVSIEDASGCPRYTARVMDGVVLKPSPMWMQRRLSACGVRPINNVVDITNYVLLECGQPLHAFDYELLADHRVIVRRAKPGETMLTLDEAPRDLTEDMLIIADPARAVAVAGVMGGAGSEVGDATARVLLESACFDARGIHRTSTTLGLMTESSYRFERGVDVTRVEWCSRRAAALMVDLCEATVAPGVIDEYPGQAPERRVSCRFDRVRSLLGVDVGADEVCSILERLEMPVAERTATACTVTVPGFRGDVEREADLIEEVARIHGLDKVPAGDPRARIVPDVSDTRTRALTDCRLALVGLGLSEIVNYSFVSHRLLDTFGLSAPERRVVLPNPVSAEHGVLRDALIPQLVESLGRNLARQNMDGAFFEVGRVFGKDGQGGIHEEERLAVGLMGRVGRTGPDAKRPVEPDEMFLWMKGVLEGLFRSLRMDGVSFVPAEAACLEVGCAVAVEVLGARLGLMGLLSQSARHNWRMNEPIAVAELELEPLLASASAGRPEVVPLAVYPAVIRDMAIVVDRTITHEDVTQSIRRAAPPELTAIDLFDIFSGEGIGEGRKSLAYSLVYRSAERTLTDEEANGFHESIKEALRDELKVETR